jgi:nitronate monooxygenase
MWFQTKATGLLGIKYPIIQGPFGGGLSSAELVASVSNAGGLGSFGAYNLSPKEIEDISKELAALTNNPYALNLWVNDIDTEALNYTEEAYKKMEAIYQPYFKELGIPLPSRPQINDSRFEKQVEALIKAKPPVFSFVFGIPAREILTECRKQHIRTIGAVTSVDEALLLEEAGVDLIVATGFEAGGHRPSFLHPAKESLTGTMSLVPQVADAVNIPVISAGGIADGRGIVAALALGASAVQIGTAFLACLESNATDVYRELLFSKERKYTLLTNSFTGRLARGIRSRIASDLQDYEKQVAPFPIQSQFLSSLRRAAIAQGKLEMISFWCGQSVPLIKHRQAAILFRSLVAETEAVIGSLK